MSIWCSLPTVGFSDWDDEQVGQVRSYATGWSNHYPATDDTVEQRACIDLAHTPTWCVPGHSDHDGYIDGVYGLGPWLRLHVDTWEHDCERVVGPVRAGVVIDEEAARALRDALTDWLDTPKVYPISPSTPSVAETPASAAGVASGAPAPQVEPRTPENCEEGL